MCSSEHRNGNTICIWLMVAATVLAMVSITTVTYFKIDAPAAEDGHTDTAKDIAKPQLRVDSIFGSARGTLPKLYPCANNTCGTHAECKAGYGKPPRCACPPDHIGDPFELCEKLECVVNDDCDRQKACVKYHCVEPCLDGGGCGLDATCQVFNHAAVCFCPSGYGGDPFVNCTKMDTIVKIDPCKPSPCGPNSGCRKLDNHAICSCLPGFIGSPPSCRPECVSDEECPSQLTCRGNKCLSPCTVCGVSAECKVTDHHANCTCPTGYIGDPSVKCEPECEQDKDCPSERPICVGHACADPCAGACGIHASCELRSRAPFCYCPTRPTNTTGDPLVYCKPFGILLDEICNPNPCGANGHCSLGADNSTADGWYPLCTCPEGYHGDGYKLCEECECTEDSGCGEESACVDCQCRKLCDSSSCGSGAVCTAGDHRVSCKCAEGTLGNPFRACYPIFMVAGIGLSGEVILRPPFNRMFSHNRFY